MADLNHDIEKYLKGELSPADRHRLEKLALDDPFLAEALEGAAEINAENFKEDLAQIHSAVDDRISQKEKSNSAWFLPMRIAAGVLLLIFSTYLVYFLMDKNDTTHELALNKTEDNFPVEKDIQPIVSDSIAPVELKDDKPSIKSEYPAEKKKDLPTVQSAPASEREMSKEPVHQENVVEFIAQAEEETKTVAEKSPIIISPTRSETVKKETQLETFDRAKKAAAPLLKTPLQEETAGYVVDKNGQRIVTGKVIDVEDGAPLPGVNVIVKGTTTGTMTDLDGNYQIQIEDTDFALVFSFIGLETKEEKIDGRTQLDVQLEQDVSELSEVVVTGYGYSDTDVITSSIPDYVPAEPEGGFKVYKIYLEDNLHYPIQAIENKVQGKVTVRFEISPTGVISDFQITKGIGFGCDEEAIRLIRQGPKWSSPKRGDIPVKGRVKVRMKFTLPK